MIRLFRALVPAFAGDVRFAFRQIARTPLLSGVIIAVIALGIGINAGLLTILNTYVWRPAPGIPADASLARVMPTALRPRGGGLANVSLSYPEILELRQRRDVFADVAAWKSTWLAVDLGGGTETVMATYTTANYFSALGISLVAGPGFVNDPDLSNAPVAVIGNALWLSHFGGSPDVIGKTIRVMNLPFTIVGVAPPRFTGVDVQTVGRPTIWLPLGTRAMLEPQTGNIGDRDVTILRSVARLARRVRAGDVGRMTTPLAARFAQTAPEERARLSIGAERLTGYVERSSDRTELVAAFFLVAALIVVITCTNVSALLLGRAAARRREIGVRLALGATRRRLVRQMLTESLVYAFAGALLGLALYIPTIKIAYALVPEIIYGLEPEPATFLFAAMFAFVVTIAFGLAPALHATRADIGEVMKNSGHQAIRRSRMQMIFVVIQLACSQPVLVVTSLVLADIRRDANDNAQLAPASVVTMSSMFYQPASAAQGRGGSRGTSPSVLEALRQRLASIPGVRSVAIGSSGYDDPSIRLAQNPSLSISRDGKEAFDASGGADAGAAARLEQLYVSADYFSTLGMPLVRGRTIGVDEDRRGSSVVVVNQAAAAILWPGKDPVGKQLVRGAATDTGRATTLQVIGVVGAAPYEDERAQPIVFAPLATAPSGWESTIAVRTSGDARAYVPRLRAAIRDVEPYAAIGNVSTFAERYADRQREAFLSNAAAFAIGAAALLLASLGLYAIIAFAVAQRTREIGIRLAMGSTAGGIVRHFFRDGLVVSGIGLAIGLPVTVAGIRIVKAMVLGFTIQNVVAVLLVVPALMAVAALASWLPARRAGRVDPLVALRSD